MEELADRQDRRERFEAALHGVKLAGHDGRISGFRQQQMAQMRARRGAH
jgi:hypothetical protein